MFCSVILGHKLGMSWIWAKLQDLGMTTGFESFWSPGLGNWQNFWVSSFDPYPTVQQLCVSRHGSLPKIERLHCPTPRFIFFLSTHCAFGLCHKQVSLYITCKSAPNQVGSPCLCHHGVVEPVGNPSDFVSPGVEQRRRSKQLPGTGGPWS